MRVVAPLLLAFSTTVLAPGEGCGGDPDGPPDGSVFFNYDVTAYNYIFDVASGTSLSSVDFTTLDSGNCISLDFRLSEASAVTLDGITPDWYGVLADTLQVCGATLTPGSHHTLSVNVHVPLETENGTDVGYSSTRDTEGQPFYYLLSWVEGCSLFGPCYDDPDDFVEITFRVTHPVGYTVLCSGTVTNSPEEGVCTNTFAGVPTYTGVGFMVSPSWKKSDLFTQNGVTVSLFDMPGAGALAATDEGALAGYFGWLESQLGPYPYGDTLRYVIGPHYWWGFEHPGNIALSDAVVGAIGSYQDTLLHTMMHELTHQWAGNFSTLESTNNFVWKEAAAEYLTFVYEAEHLPPTYPTRTLRVWKSNALAVGYYPVPLEEPDLFDFYSDVYGSGPFVLFRQLEGLFSRSQVVAALGDVLGSEDPQFVSVETIKSALELHTGADLTQYFNDWVYGSGAPRWPIVGVRWEDPDGDGTYTINVTQTQGSNTIYGFKATLRLEGAGSEVMDVPFSFGVDGTTSSIVVEARPGFVISSIVVDPYDEALVTPQGASRMDPLPGYPAGGF